VGGGFGDPASVYLSTKWKEGSSAASASCEGYQETPDGSGYRYKVRDPGRPPYTQRGNMLFGPEDSTSVRGPALTSYQMGFWSSRPGPDQLVGRFDYTFYHEEFRKNAGNPPLGVEETNGASVKYYKDGPFYVGDFVIDDPGYYIKQVKLRVYVYIWEG